MEIFDYDNILLLPRKCRVESRSEYDAQRGTRRPRLPHPCRACQHEDRGGWNICTWLAQNGYFS